MFSICLKVSIVLMALYLFGIVESLWPAIITAMFVPALWVVFIGLPFVVFAIFNWNKI